MPAAKPEPVRDLPADIDFREQGRGPRTLRYTYRALEFVEQAVEQSMMLLFTRVAGRKDITLREIRILVQAGLLHETPDLDADTVQTLLDDGAEKGLGLQEIMVGILTALLNCKVLRQDAATARPPRAARPPRGTKSSRKRKP